MTKSQTRLYSIAFVLGVLLNFCLGEIAAAQPSALSGSVRLIARRNNIELAPSFDDEFNLLSIWNGASGTWRTDIGYGGPHSPSNFAVKGSGQLNLYVDSRFGGTSDRPLGLNPFEVRQGILSISANQVGPDIAPLMWNYRYTSGLLSTRTSFAQRYGYFELRAKLPRGRGLWPAFWLLPASGAWPPEIDILEQVGQNPTKYQATIHSGATGGHTFAARTISIPDASRAFHNYGVLWLPTRTIWYFDGVEVARQVTPPDARVPMFMLVNLAIGGAWAGTPPANTRFPIAMQVDYVRAYRIK